MIWWPLGKYDKLISIDDRNIFLWNIDTSNKSAKVCNHPSVYQYIISILTKYLYSNINFSNRLWNVKNLHTICLCTSYFTGINLNSYITGDLTGISWHASKFTWWSLGSTQSEFNCCNIRFITSVVGSTFYGVNTCLEFLWFSMLLSVAQLLKCCSYIFIFQCIILRKSTAIEHAHVRDVDYNPKKQNIIVSLTLPFLFLIVSSNTSYIYIKWSFLWIRFL